MSDKFVSRTCCIRMPTQYGEFQLCSYSNTEDDKAHLALYMGDIDTGENVLVRIHSECFTGDVFGSQRCDCGDQLDRALREIAREGRGALLYMRQEGRGIGLLQKIKAYNLQDLGHDTVDANLMLGHEADERDYTLAARILDDLGISSVRLITNNPLKIEALELEGINVTERIELESTVTCENARYLQTKVKRMNHMLNINELESALSRGTKHETQPAD